MAVFARESHPALLRPTSRHMRHAHLLASSTTSRWGLCARCHSRLACTSCHNELLPNPSCSSSAMNVERACSGGGRGCCGMSPCCRAGCSGPGPCPSRPGWSAACCAGCCASACGPDAGRLGRSGVMAAAAAGDAATAAAGLSEVKDTSESGSMTQGCRFQAANSAQMQFSVR